MRTLTALFLLLVVACSAQVQSGKVYHGILWTGQSLSTGCQGYSVPANTTGQVTSGTPYSNLSLSAGTTALEAAAVYQLDVAPLIALAPTFVCNNNGSPPDGGDSSSLPQEYPGINAVNELTYLSGGSSGIRYILGLHGASGRQYSIIGGPTDVSQPSANPSFADGQTQLVNMRNAVVAAGSSFVLDAVAITHGETDGFQFNRFYDQNLNHLQWDYETGANGTIGRNGLLPLFTDQENSWGFYLGAGKPPVAAVLQWKAAENNPGRIFLCLPIYQYATGYLADGVHKGPSGYRSVGEMYGKCMYQVLVNHQNWVPLMPKTIALSGSTVTAKFFVPVGSLSMDTTIVPSQTNSGFEFTDGLTAIVNRITQASGPAPVSPVITFGGTGYTSAPTITVGCGAAYTANLTGGVVTSVTRTAAGSSCTILDIIFSAPTPTVTISSVSITASDTVQVVLSGIPTGPSPTLRYAYTAPAAVGGGKGNLRDGDTSTGRTGEAMYDWCVTFDAQIPFASKLTSVARSSSSGASISGVN